jgi:amidase
VDYARYREHDAVALAELVRTGEATPGELLEAALVRAEQVNGAINAITEPMWEDARKRAAAADLSGPLAGVPFLLKDLAHEWAGSRCNYGSAALRGTVTEETSVVVRRWLDAGLVPFGRTNSPELGIKAITEPEAFGPTRNPWNRGHTSGGSSGGAAAAVAAGIVPMAAASDGGGSIRIPAACCGLFGLKPGRGLVPAGPQQSESFYGAAVDGVLARTVRDAAAGLDALIGTDPAGPYPLRQPGSFRTEIEQDPRPLRIGFSADSALGDPHPEAVAAMTGAAELLESLGHHVEPAPMPADVDALAIDFLKAWSVNVAAQIDEAAANGADPADFELDTRLLAAGGRAVSGPEHVVTVQRWHQHVRRLARFHEDYDLLLTPSLAGPPVPVGSLTTPPAKRLAGRAVLKLRLGRLLRETGLVDQVARENLRHVPYTQLANLTGRPAMSVPLHWTAGGLPLGVQFVGPLGGEGTLFSLAAQLERAQPWAHREPPL